MQVANNLPFDRLLHDLGQKPEKAADFEEKVNALALYLFEHPEHLKNPEDAEKIYKLVGAISVEMWAFKEYSATERGKNTHERLTSLFNAAQGIEQPNNRTVLLQASTFKNLSHDEALKFLEEIKKNDPNVVRIEIPGFPPLHIDYAIHVFKEVETFKPADLWKETSWKCRDGVIKISMGDLAFLMKGSSQAAEIMDRLNSQVERYEKEADDKAKSEQEHAEALEKLGAAKAELALRFEGYTVQEMEYALICVAHPGRLFDKSNPKEYLQLYMVAHRMGLNLDDFIEKLLVSSMNKALKDLSDPASNQELFDFFCEHLNFINKAPSNFQQVIADKMVQHVFNGGKVKKEHELTLSHWKIKIKLPDLPDLAHKEQVGYFSKDPRLTSVKQLALLAETFSGATDLVVIGRRFGVFLGKDATDSDNALTQEEIARCRRAFQGMRNLKNVEFIGCKINARDHLFDCPFPKATALKFDCCTIYEIPLFNLSKMDFDPTFVKYNAYVREVPQTTCIYTAQTSLMPGLEMEETFFERLQSVVQQFWKYLENQR